MIINREEEQFRHSAKEIHLLSGAATVCIPANWLFGKEQIFPHKSNAYFTHTQTDGQILRITLTTYLTQIHLPNSPSLWVRSCIPEQISEEQFLILHEGNERLGHHMWYRAAYVWEENHKTVRTHFWSRFGEYPQLFEITGEIDNTGRQLISSVVASVRLHLV